MKKIVSVTDLVSKHFRRMGMRPLDAPKINANGPDLTVIYEGRALTVEIKRARRTRRNSLQVPAVERNRRQDDLIAVVLPSGYTLIEPMADHLKLCTPKGYRTLSGLA